MFYSLRYLKYVFIVLAVLLILIAVAFFARHKYPLLKYKFGEKVDSLHGVYVYYNGSVGNVKGRNYAANGYNLGLKYQCVEFVKRYYYQHYNHMMPTTYGHAREFYDKGTKDGGLNTKRNLLQFSNASMSKPQEGDLLVFGGTPTNQYGHVAIISKVFDSQIEIIQQNPGPTASSRVLLGLLFQNGRWRINSKWALGWLRKR